MVPQLKTFIEEHIDLIEHHRWSGLYSYAKAEIPFQIGNLSYNLIKAGINPLDDLNVIYSEMFCDSSELEEITIPNNITEIKRQAFMNCYVLKSVTIPKSVKVIDDTAFKGCYELETILFEGTAHELIDGIKITTKTFWDAATGTIQCSDYDVIVDFDGTLSIEEETV